MASDVAADSGYLSVVISSSLSSFGAQRRFPASITIGELKASCWGLIRARLAVIRSAHIPLLRVYYIQGKLELITGATASLMQLQLYNSDEDKLVCELDDDKATLASTGAENGWRINVIDKDPTKKRGEFEDLSQVQKYEMSSEDYSKRTGELFAS